MGQKIIDGELIAITYDNLGNYSSWNIQMYRIAVSVLKVSDC